MAKKKSHYKKGAKGKVSFQGAYAFIKKGERVFVLIHPKTGRGHAYESPQAAIKDGWIKV